MPWSRFITIVVGLGLAVGLKFLLSRTRLGVAMRAVVDNRELAGPQRHQAGAACRCSRGRSGSAMAAVAGIFLAEELATLDVQTLTLLIIDGVRGRDHRPAEEPAVDVLRRAADRAGRSSSSRTS